MIYSCERHKEFLPKDLQPRVLPAEAGHVCPACQHQTWVANPPRDRHGRFISFADAEEEGRREKRQKRAEAILAQAPLD